MRRLPKKNLQSSGVKNVAGSGSLKIKKASSQAHARIQLAGVEIGRYRRDNINPMHGKTQFIKHGLVEKIENFN